MPLGMRIYVSHKSISMTVMSVTVKQLKSEDAVRSRDLSDPIRILMTRKCPSVRLEKVD